MSPPTIMHAWAIRVSPAQLVASLRAWVKTRPDVAMVSIISAKHLAAGVGMGIGKSPPEIISMIQACFKTEVFRREMLECIQMFRCASNPYSTCSPLAHVSGARIAEVIVDHVLCVSGEEAKIEEVLHHDIRRAHEDNLEDCMSTLTSDYRGAFKTQAKAFYWKREILPYICFDYASGPKGSLNGYLTIPVETTSIRSRRGYSLATIALEGVLELNRIERDLPIIEEQLKQAASVLGIKPFDKNQNELAFVDDGMKHPFMEWMPNNNKAQFTHLDQDGVEVIDWEDTAIAKMENFEPKLMILACGEFITD